MITDEQRIDWLENQCYDVRYGDDLFYVTREFDDQEFSGDSLRKAVDAAIKDEEEGEKP